VSGASKADSSPDVLKGPKLEDFVARVDSTEEPIGPQINFIDFGQIGSSFSVMMNTNIYNLYTQEICTISWWELGENPQMYST
jgi:hypothetical protein